MCPKDVDLFFNIDSDRTYQRVKSIINGHNVRFESCFPGNWCFREGNQMVEILPLHRGKSYLACRRKATKRTILGIEFLVAPADYCPP